MGLVGQNQARRYGSWFSRGGGTGAKSAVYGLDFVLRVASYLLSINAADIRMYRLGP